MWCDALGFCSLEIQELLIHLQILYQLSKVLAMTHYKMDISSKDEKPLDSRKRTSGHWPWNLSKFPGSDVWSNTPFSQLWESTMQNHYLGITYHQPVMGLISHCLSLRTALTPCWWSHCMSGNLCFSRTGIPKKNRGTIALILRE